METDYADRVALMQRLGNTATPQQPLNRPIRRTRTDTMFDGIAMLLIGAALGVMLLASLRACDPLADAVPAVRLSCSK